MAPGAAPSEEELAALVSGLGLAADDVEQLAALSPEHDLRLSLCRDLEGGLRFKFYRLNDDIPLSDALPMMENMGLRVISEHPYKVDAADGVSYIQDFEVESLQGELDVDVLDENFEEAFARLWRGDAENDGFNRLIFTAGQVPVNTDVDAQAQVTDVLAQIDAILADLGSDKTRIVDATIFLASRSII